MKSYEKKIFFFHLAYYSRRCLAAETQNLFEHARRLGSRDYFDVIYSLSLQHGSVDPSILMLRDLYKNYTFDILKQTIWMNAEFVEKA